MRGLLVTFSLLFSFAAQAAEPNLLDVLYFIIARKEIGGPSRVSGVREKVVSQTDDQLIVEATRTDRYGEPYRETWTVIDKDKCILQLNTDFPIKEHSYSTQYYFNNLLPGHVNSGDTSSTGTRETYTGRHLTITYPALIFLTDNKAAFCEYNLHWDGKNLCYNRLTLSGFNPDELELQTRILKAFDYLYNNFCTYAKSEKPY
jgi:hypothetical protein